MKKLLAFLWVLGSMSLSAQNRVIKGLVKNGETNEGLFQASIKLKTTGVLTNKNGEFTVTVEDRK